MGKNKVCTHPVLEIFIACLIPNLGAWIIAITLLDKIRESEEKIAEKSILDPPGWVKMKILFENLKNLKLENHLRSFQSL